jgi:chorismate synthase
MAGNTFGKLLQITTFGESHGTSIGGILDGVPSGLTIDIEAIQSELNRRRPGTSHLTTSRKEQDIIEIHSGVLKNEDDNLISIGTPIGFGIVNKDAKSKDYSYLDNSFRPSHADYTYEAKYGLRDIRGGGRSSARETACRVVGGAIAKQLLFAVNKVEVSAYVERVQDISVPFPPAFFETSVIDENIVRCPSKETADRMINRIEEVKNAGDTVGGAIVVVAKNVPSGWGEPVFDKLEADLAKALMSIPAVKGIEVGSGFSGSLMKGSEHNDAFSTDSNGEVITETNRSGGIQGGISNGEEIILRIGFKPVSTIKKEQNTVNRDSEKTTISGKGRHDPCVLPRAVPIVEAMVALVLGDHLLRQRSARL